METSFFQHDGLKLAFYDVGAGVAVLLIHGFASNARVNWFDTGWADLLVKNGYRVIAFDHRGHGLSDKPHDPAAYDPPKMAHDALALLDHLNVPQAHIIGYSMGGRVTAFLLIESQVRALSAVIGGIGAGLTEGTGDPAPIIAALEAPSISQVETQTGRLFRAFADQTKSDRAALAACMRSSRKKILESDLADIHVPVLIAVGTKDEIAGAPQALANMISGAKVLEIEGRDHMRAVGDPFFKKGVLAFLADVEQGKTKS